MILNVKRIHHQNKVRLYSNTYIKKTTENILAHNAKKALDTLIRSRHIIKTYVCLHVSIKVTCISFDPETFLNENSPTRK